MKKLLASAVALAALPALADTSIPSAGDIVTTAQTTFNTVGTFIAGVVGFFVIVKIVKWIRK